MQRAMPPLDRLGRREVPMLSSSLLGLVSMGNVLSQVPVGAIVVMTLEPNGYVIVRVETMTPMGPMVNTCPAIMVVVRCVPGPMVKVLPLMMAMDGATLVMVAPPTISYFVSVALALEPPIIMPCTSTPDGPMVMVSPSTTSVVADIPGPYVIVFECTTTTLLPIAVSISPPATTTSDSAGACDGLKANEFVPTTI